jgi:hypothetical protein
MPHGRLEATVKAKPRICTHPRPLELLPVVNFSYDFACLDCGNVAAIMWTEDLAKLNYKDAVAAARDLARQELAALVEEPPCSA